MTVIFFTCHAFTQEMRKLPDSGDEVLANGGQFALLYLLLFFVLCICSAGCAACSRALDNAGTGIGRLGLADTILQRV